MSRGNWPRSRQEHHHERTLSDGFSVASTHARRHADAQACTPAQTAYIRAVRRLAAYLHRPPDTATIDDLRNFQLHLVDQGTPPTTLNATITGLKFFCEITLDRAELTAKMQPVHVPRTLLKPSSMDQPVQLSPATTLHFFKSP
ncbi:MAG: phage integrase N-terminal SAM-like domain-containing protein [Burkholderiaceae bacterium]